MGRFTDKSVVITGGSSGIGLATALRIIQEGGRVLISGSNRERLEAVKAAHPAIETIQNDASNPAAARQLGIVAQQHFGAIDGAFLNAGVAMPSMLGDLTEDIYRHQVDLNIGGPLFGAQALVPLMSKGAAILMTASTAAHRGYAGAAVYSATKGAVRAMVRSLARELAGQGIRVNAISPGGTRTDFFNRLGLSADQQRDVEAQIEATNPLARMASPEEVAGLAAFLLSSEAAYINGADYGIDGGEAQL